jgi:hypothetical protein
LGLVRQCLINREAQELNLEMGVENVS